MCPLLCKVECFVLLFGGSHFLYWCTRNSLDDWSNFRQLTFLKIMKTVAIRCQILRLRCTKFNFGWGLVPDPAGGAHSAPPDPKLDIRGLLLGEERGKVEVEGEEWSHLLFSADLCPWGVYWNSHTPACRSAAIELNSCIYCFLPASCAARRSMSEVINRKIDITTRRDHVSAKCELWVFCNLPAITWRRNGVTKLETNLERLYRGLRKMWNLWGTLIIVCLKNSDTVLCTLHHRDKISNDPKIWVKGAST